MVRLTPRSKLTTLEKQYFLTQRAGAAIAQKHLPAFVPSLETYFLTCILHDIGTTQENLHATSLSFEFFGGYLALDLLQKYGAPKSQAESVAEAIIRHQDLGDVGTISTVGQLIQLSTLFGKSSLIHILSCIVWRYLEC